MTYRELTTGLRAHLRDNAEMLGCTPEAIQFGKYGELPADTPFVLYYVRPAGATSESLDNFTLRDAEITIFCGYEDTDGDTLESHVCSVEMAETAAALLEDYLGAFLDDAADYDFDTFYSTIAVAYATATANYSRSTAEQSFG